MRDLATAFAHLSAVDPDIARVLAEIGPPPLRTRPATFATLLQIITSQQISVAAATSIWQRLRFAGFDQPAVFLAADDAALRAAGLSRAKIGYGRAAAKAVSDGALDLAGLSDQPLEAAHGSLRALPGVGRWTADIFCLFALGHGDVWPAGDIALQEALRRLRGWTERPSAAQTDIESALWRPWRGAAALVLWNYYRTEVLA